MSRLVLCLLLAASLCTAVFAQGEDPTAQLNKPPQFKQPDEAKVQVWTQVSGVTRDEVLALLERLNEVIGSQAEPPSTDVLASLHQELGRQTAAFKKAYQAALPSQNSKADDIDDLYAQVIEGKAHVDPNLLKALATTYETLYIQFGQYMNSRFLVANSGGIPTYQSGEAKGADAAKVATAAAQHVAAYQANMAQSIKDLKARLDLESGRH
jgi:hypothetical protein